MLAAEISNAPPVVEDRSVFDFVGWTVRELTASATTQWDLSADGATVIERRNGEPALLVGDFPAFGRYELSIRVADNGDDDYVGLALGVDPVTLGTAAADFLLVDWKRGDQSGARRGLALSRVHGAPATAELWLHLDQAANGAAHRVDELARAATLGSTGWARHTEYRLRIDYAPSRLRVWVDDALEIDVPGAFPSGRLALYDYSQANAVFSAVGSALVVWGTEGSPAQLRAPFTDAGIADLHTAEVDWGDGSVEPAPVSEEPGQGEVVTGHVYLDDGERTASLCVTDDDGGEGCASIPSRVANVAPALALALVSSGYRQDPVTLAGTTFTDPGVLDLHTATVDWGDGFVGTATISESGGSGSLAAAHSYDAPGEYLVRVCVDDGDGGRSLRRAGAGPRRPLPRPRGSPRRSRSAEARPGQRVTYTLQVRNPGTLPASGVILTDLLPEHLVFVSASAGGSYAGGAVTWTLGSMAPGASQTRTLVADVAPTAPFGAVVTNAALVVDDGAAGPDGAPENNQASVPLRLSDAVTPIVTLPAWAPVVESGSLALTGARWSDTTAGENHSATVDWGDGASGSATLSPAAGTGGNIVANHVYIEDGVFAIEVCVADAAGHVGCAGRSVTVTNSAPVVVEPGGVSLRAWREEEYETSDPSANWAVAADGLSVNQTVNSQPSVFFSPLPRLRGLPRGLDPGRVGGQLGRRLHRVRSRLRGGGQREPRGRLPAPRLEAGGPEQPQGPRALPCDGRSERAASSGCTTAPWRSWRAPRRSATPAGATDRSTGSASSTRRRDSVSGSTTCCSSISRATSPTATSASTTTRSRMSATGASRAASSSASKARASSCGLPSPTSAPRHPYRDDRLGRWRRSSRRWSSRRTASASPPPITTSRTTATSCSKPASRTTGGRGLRAVPAAGSQPAAGGPSRPRRFRGRRRPGRDRPRDLHRSRPPRQPHRDRRLGRWRERAGAGGRGRRRGQPLGLARLERDGHVRSRNLRRRRRRRQRLRHVERRGPGGATAARGVQGRLRGRPRRRRPGFARRRPRLPHRDRQRRRQHPERASRSPIRSRPTPASSRAACCRACSR